MVDTASREPELKPFVVETRRPGIRGSAERLREVVDSRELLAFLAWRDLTVRYKQSTIGVLWAVLQPLLLAAAFTVFFGKLAGLGSDGDSYALATFVGAPPLAARRVRRVRRLGQRRTGSGSRDTRLFPAHPDPTRTIRGGTRRLLRGVRRGARLGRRGLAVAHARDRMGAGLPPSRARDRGRRRLLARSAQRPLP